MTQTKQQAAAQDLIQTVHNLLKSHDMDTDQGTRTVIALTRMLMRNSTRGRDEFHWRLADTYHNIENMLKLIEQGSDSRVHLNTMVRELRKQFQEEEKNKRFQEGCALRSLNMILAYLACTPHRKSYPFRLSSAMARMMYAGADPVKLKNQMIILF